MKDKIFFFLSLISLCGLFFIAGAAVMHFYPNTAQGLRNAFIGAKGVSFQLANVSAAKISNKKPPRSFVRKEDGKYYQGVTLFTTPALQGALLVNEKGKVLHRWNTPFSKAWPNPEHINRKNNSITNVHTVIAYPNGDLLAQFYGAGDTPYGYGLAKFDKDSNVLWTFSENAHHDFYVSPDDGTISVIVHYFQKTPVKGFEHFSYPQLVDEIVTLSPDGKVIDRIPILSALEGTPYADFYRKRSMKFIKKIRENWDETHTNSVRRLTVEMSKRYPRFEAGDYLVSMRNNKGIAVISHKTKKAIWGVCCKWHGQHAATFIGNNKIMLLDNYGKTWDGISNSQVVAYDITEGKKTILYGEHLLERINTVNGGRLQLLPNGNVLVVESARGHITEISASDRRIVWKYTLNPSGRYTRKRAISDATRYSPDYFTFLKDKKAPRKKTTPNEPTREVKKN